jgi:HSP20 family molecular chaperone IbpA
MMLSHDSNFKKIFDYLFDETQMNTLKYGNLIYHPVKITSDDIGHKIKFVVPGISKENISLIIKDSEIIVSYEGKQTEFVAPFKKTYKIPSDVDEKNINAKMENGILELDLPLIKKKLTERIISLN